MAEWRAKGSRCPLDERKIDVHVCGECRFFRGATTFLPDRPELRGEFSMLCNWPRDGAYDALAAAPLPEFMLKLDLPEL